MHFDNDFEHSFDMEYSSTELCIGTGGKLFSLSREELINSRGTHSKA